MFIGITLESDHGQEARTRFAKTPEGGAHVVGDPSVGGSHQLTAENIQHIFQSLDVPFSGNALESVRTLVKQNKVEKLFQIVHIPSANQEPPKQEWSRAQSKEMLELNVMGFTLSMMATHFATATEVIVRHLAHVIFSGDHLIKDPSKPRHQKIWVRSEMEFLIGQLQIVRTPTEISALMGRDSLGIAYKMFQSLVVPIPRAVLADYGVAVRTEPWG